jgi:hypothetical protein
MTLDNIVAQIDAEIAQLQQAKALLSGRGAGVGNGRKAGRPVKKPGAQAIVRGPKPLSKRKPLSAEARKAIGDAQRKRWAAAKAPAKRAAKKQTIHKLPPGKQSAKAPAKKVAFKKSGPVKPVSVRPASGAAPF